MTLNEIQEEWRAHNADYSITLHRNTFMSYKRKAEEMFDININCNRSTNEYYIEYQRTGVKINVRLLPKRKAQLYMSYAKVRNESDKLVDMILSIKRMYSYFGHSSGIVNISADEEELFDKK